MELAVAAVKKNDTEEKTNDDKEGVKRPRRIAT